MPDRQRPAAFREVPPPITSAFKKRGSGGCPVLQQPCGRTLAQCRAGRVQDTARGYGPLQGTVLQLTVIVGQLQDEVVVLLAVPAGESIREVYFRWPLGQRALFASPSPSTYAYALSTSVTRSCGAGALVPFAPQHHALCPQAPRPTPPVNQCHPFLPYRRSVLVPYAPYSPDHGLGPLSVVRPVAGGGAALSELRQVHSIKARLCSLPQLSTPPKADLQPFTAPRPSEWPLRFIQFLHVTRLQFANQRYNPVHVTCHAARLKPYNKGAQPQRPPFLCPIPAPTRTHLLVPQRLHEQHVRVKAHCSRAVAHLKHPVQVPEGA